MSFYMTTNNAKGVLLYKVGKPFSNPVIAPTSDSLRDSIQVTVRWVPGTDVEETSWSDVF